MIASRDPGTLRTAARTAEAEGRIADAEALLSAAVQAAPGFAPAHADLARLLQQTGRSDEALGLIDARIGQFSQAVWPLSIKAALLDVERRTAESLPVHETIVARVPQVPVSWINFGQALRAAGRTAEAIAAYRRAVEVEPCNGSAWWTLASIRSTPLGQSDVEQLRRALAECADRFQLVPLHFALGRALEDAGDFEQSFKHYDAGNQLRAQLVPAASAGIEEMVRRSEALFTCEFFAARAGAGCGEEGPIFIVGMPRSGSTLIEQILATHPKVEALGELPQLQDLAREIGGVEGVGRLDANELAQLGERYLASVRRYRRTGRPFFTDKLPANWQLIGLIQLILPQAKIVDVRREPMACCFANFAFYFNRQTNLAEGLEDLGRYYRSYARLLRHLEAVLPDQIRTFSYERLVDEPEESIRSLFAFLGLPFDSGGLEAFRNDRPIHTPSAEQVRQPIRGDANQRWQSYAAWLAPLRQALAGREAGAMTSD